MTRRFYHVEAEEENTQTCKGGLITTSAKEILCVRSPCLSSECSSAQSTPNRENVGLADYPQQAAHLHDAQLHPTGGVLAPRGRGTLLFSSNTPPSVPARVPRAGNGILKFHSPRAGRTRVRSRIRRGAAEGNPSCHLAGTILKKPEGAPSVATAKSRTPSAPAVMTSPHGSKGSESDPVR